MLTKILYTILVIAVVLFVARWRAEVNRRRELTVVHAPPIAAAPTSARARTIAYLVAFGLMASAISGYYWYWSNWREVVTVRVINTGTGEVVTYDAHKGSIHDREFQTTDGWRVTVAEGERVEIRHR